MTIRPSIVVSAGERVRGLSHRVQELIEERSVAAKEVQEFLEVTSTGQILRRGWDGAEDLLGSVEGLRHEEGEEHHEVYSINSRCFAEEAGEPLRKGLRQAWRAVHDREKLAKIIRHTGQDDSRQSFVYVLADCQGPVSSVVPGALLRSLEAIAGSPRPIVVNLFLCLPDLFDVSETEWSLWRAHALLSEIEFFLFGSEDQGRSYLPFSWKCWLVGATDLNGGTGLSFEAALEPSAQFIVDQMLGRLERDESWTHELSNELNGRRTFLSSFGQAGLGFPRAYLSEVSRLEVRRALALFLGQSKRSVDLAKVAAESQGWIREQKLPDLARRLEMPTGGQSAYTSPPLPEFDPRTLEGPRFAEAAAALLDEEPGWGIALQEAGNGLSGQYRVEFIEGSDALVDGEPGLEGARIFAESLGGVGAGLTEATVGSDVLNLENLILEVQGFFARESDSAGDPKNLIELDRLIPGKIEVIERLVEREASERARLDGWVDASENDSAEPEDGEDSDPDSSVAPEADDSGRPADATSSESEEDPRSAGSPPIQDAEEQAPSSSDAEPAPEPKPSVTSAAEQRANVEERLRNLQGDRRQFETELAELKKKRKEELRRITESRRLAIDPTRRHILLQKISDRERPDQAAERQDLMQATTKRVEALDLLRTTAHELRRAVWRHFVLLPIVALIGVLAVYALATRKLPWLDPTWQWPLEWSTWALVVCVVVGLFVTSRKGLEYVNARGSHQGALRGVGVAAHDLWRGHVARRKKRFDFLVHAEAMTVLEELQKEVRSEASRLEVLQKALRAYEGSARRGLEEAGLTESLYQQSVLSESEARRLVAEDPKLIGEIGDALGELSLSEVVRAFRRSPDKPLSEQLSREETKIVERCQAVLQEWDLGTVLASQRSSETRDLDHRLSGLEVAAVPWILVEGQPRPGIAKRLVFYPKSLPNSLLEGWLQRGLDPALPIEWVASEDRDRLTLLEIFLGFPTFSISQLRAAGEGMEEQILRRVIDPAIPALSLPPPESELGEIEAYALVEAALAWLRSAGEGVRDSVSPDDLVEQQRSREFLPMASVERLVEQLKVEVESCDDGEQRIARFVEGLDQEVRGPASTLLAG